MEGKKPVHGDLVPLHFHLFCPRDDERMLTIAGLRSASCWIEAWIPLEDPLAAVVHCSTQGSKFGVGMNDRLREKREMGKVGLRLAVSLFLFRSVTKRIKERGRKEENNPRKKKAME